jgi:DNA-directed RNA polymerase specialized sigma24 family protein
MTTHDPIPMPPPSTTTLRAPTLDRKRTSPTVAAMSSDDDRDVRKRPLLRAQPWGRILAQLTAIALKRIYGRSVSDAQDYAQSAIADAYESVERGGWDPDRGPLMSYLVARVITTAAAERRRKRNTCEVWLDEEGEEDGEAQPPSLYEKYLADGKPAPDVALHRLRFASTFEDRLLTRLADDPPAQQVIALMKEGLFKPIDLAPATGKEAVEIKETLRRIRYHAREITKELSAQATTARSGRHAKQVTQ